MIRVELVAVHVDSGPLFRSGGSVNHWTQSVAREVKAAATSLAPPRRSNARHRTWATGRLAASFYKNVDANPIVRIIGVEVGNTAPHATYVHEGTANNGAGYIYTELGYSNRFVVDRWVDTGVRPQVRGYYMPVDGRLMLRVRGQRANPFLRDGYNAVARRHRALPRME